MVDFSSSMAELLLHKLSTTPEWMEQALCLDQEKYNWDPMWKPEAAEMAETICPQCPVRAQCGGVAEEIMQSQERGSTRALLGVFGAKNHFNREE